MQSRRDAGKKMALGLGLCAGLATAACGQGRDLTLTAEGKPSACIVVSAKPTRSATVAAVELRDHIRKISGAELPIVADAGKGVRILVGESAATRAGTQQR